MCANCELTSEIGRSVTTNTATAESRDAAPAETTTLFRGGVVYTQNPQQPWAQAIAVRGRDIIAVGSDEEVSAAAGLDARIIDLAGRMVLPGFVEAHIHPLFGGFATSGVDLQLPSKRAALDAIAAHAQANPSGSISGFGWRMDMFGDEPPHRKDLDAIVGDRPAYFFAIDGHSLWVNTKALEVADVTKDSSDPVPGFSYYTRDADGAATGFVLEAPAMLALVNAVDPITKDRMAQLFEDWLPKAAAAGITGVFDAGMPSADDDPVGLASVYAEVEAKGRLPFRVVASHLIKGSPIDKAVAQTQRLAQLLDTELVRGGVLKILGDGTPDGHTACMLAPYADRPDCVGESPFTPDEWRRLVVDADAAGIDVHIHACGDATVRFALDAIEEAIRTNPPRDRRHAIAHLVLIADSDLPRFRELGVIAQFSANWFSADPSSVGLLTDRFGPDRQRVQYQARTLLSDGAAIAFGTDWPAAGYVSTYKPLDAIEVSVTRQLVGMPEAPILEPVAERLDLEQALYANTLGAAWQLRLEHLVGSLEVGKRADLVVLRDNLFEVPHHQIAATPIDITMMNGQFTHGE